MVKEFLSDFVSEFAHGLQAGDEVSVVLLASWIILGGALGLSELLGSNVNLNFNSVFELIKSIFIKSSKYKIKKQQD